MNEYYQDLLVNLNLRICSEYGTVRAFCKKYGFSETSLSKVFRGERAVSVKLFTRITNALGLSQCDNSAIEENISLPEYLKIDHDSIVKTVFNVILR